MKTLYVISLVLQVSGALLLIVEWFGKTEKILQQKYFNTSNAELGKEVENSIEITVDHTRIKNVLINLYTNRATFVYILVGYLISIWGSIETNRICITIIVLFGAIILTVFSRVIIKYLAKRNSRLEQYENILKNNVPDGVVAVIPVPEMNCKISMKTSE